MRGDARQPTSMFSYVSVGERVPADHPLRPIRAQVDEVLRELSREFGGLYAAVGRPSIPPERLLRAQLLQLFYSIRSERVLMEQLDYNILFRWFVGLEIDESVWTPTVFTKNRDVGVLAPGRALRSLPTELGVRLRRDPFAVTASRLP